MSETALAVVLLITSLAIIILAAGLFVNSIEWFGKHLNIGQGMVGSVFAAIGTALPETLIPVVAILFTAGSSAHEVGVGAILGAPFLLATIALGQLGFSVWFFARANGRAPQIAIDQHFVRRDLTFFLLFYSSAVTVAFIPVQSLRVGVAVGLVIGYAVFVYLNLKEGGEEAEHDELNPLHFAPRLNTPHLWLVLGQLAVAVGLLIIGARLFVGQVEGVAEALGAPPLLLALIIAPLATEFPETFNSVLWVRQRKDVLAVGNITGAMVFQSAFPVALGVALTSWVLTEEALVAALITIIMAAAYYLSVRITGGLPRLLLAAGVLTYLGYVAYVLL